MRPEDYGLDLCDQGEDDPDICYRFQHTRAEAAEAEVERLKGAVQKAVEALQYARSLLPAPLWPAGHQDNVSAAGNIAIALRALKGEAQGE